MRVTISHVMDGDRVITFKQPIVLDVTHDEESGYMYIADNEYQIQAYGSNDMELVFNTHEDIIFLWDQYGKAYTENNRPMLTNDGLKLSKTWHELAYEVKRNAATK